MSWTDEIAQMHLDCEAVEIDLGDFPQESKGGHGMSVTEIRDEVTLSFPTVLADTSRMDRDEWLALRKQGLGGSDAAWVVGRHPYKSTYTGWAEKVGVLPEVDLSDRESIQWGNILEPVVATEFSTRYGHETLELPVMLAHPNLPFLLANVDRFLIEDGEIVGVLEVKTAGLRQSEHWDGDQVPDHYWMQVQHYLLVTGLEFGYIAVLIGGQELKAYRIERDDEWLAAYSLAAVEMWERITSNFAPEADGSDSTLSTLKSQWDPEPGSVVDLPETAVDIIASLAALKARAEEIDAEVKKNQAELMTMLSDYEIGRVNGEVVVTWKKSSRSTLDTKRIKETHPEIAAEFTKTSETRTLLPKYGVLS